MTITAFCVHPFISPLDHWRKNDDPIGWWNAKRKMFAHRLSKSERVPERASVVSPNEKRGNWKTVRCGELREALNDNKSPLGKSFRKALLDHRMCTHFPNARYVKGEVFKQARAAGGDVMISEALEEDAKVTMGELKSHLCKDVGLFTTVEETIWSKFVEESQKTFNETKKFLLAVDNPLENAGKDALTSSESPSPPGIFKKTAFSIAKFAWKAAKGVARFVKWLISFLYNSPRTAIALSIFSRAFMLGVCNMIRNSETYKNSGIQSWICHGKAPKKLETQVLGTIKGETILEQVNEETFKKTDTTGEEKIYKIPEEASATAKEEVKELVVERMMGEFKEMAALGVATTIYKPLGNILKIGSGVMVIVATAGMGSDVVTNVLENLIDLLVESAKATTPTIIDWIAVDVGVQFFYDMLNDFVTGRCMGCLGKVTSSSIQVEKATAHAKHDVWFHEIRKNMDIAVNGIKQFSKKNKVILGDDPSKEKILEQEASVGKLMNVIMISRNNLISKAKDISLTDLVLFDLAASVALYWMENDTDMNIDALLALPVIIAYAADFALTVADLTVKGSKIAAHYIAHFASYVQKDPTTYSVPFPPTAG